MTLENFRFHNEHDDEYEKVFIPFWTLWTYLCNSVLVDWLLGLAARKSLETIINKLDELKLKHSHV